MISKTDLHVHLLQSLVAEDLFTLAKDHYKEINWNRFEFLDRYEQIFGIRLDPVSMFERAIKTNDLTEIKEIGTYRFKGEGNFDEFDIKSFFPLCVTGYYFDKGDYKTVLKTIINRHKKEGYRYIEYRNGFMFSTKEEWTEWHVNFASYLKELSTDTFQAKYIVRIGPKLYPYVKEMIEEHKELKDTIVGVDFSGREIAPESLVDFYQEIKKDHLENPDEAVDVVVHIGENFYDKTIESAIRWCHQSALLGAKRLGHCIALGLDPEVATKRQQHAHESETVEERISQIQYDLKHHEKLESYGVSINKQELNDELVELKRKDKQDLIHRRYTQQRLEEIRKRQDYVLDELTNMGTVIETCPTSNLCIGGVPSIDTHSFMKLYQSDVPLAICTDDPGVFGVTLEDEIEFLMKSFNLSKDELTKRLGDPYRFRLKG